MKFKAISENHLFNKSFHYRRCAEKAIIPMIENLPKERVEKEKRRLIKKLQIDRENFDDEQFIQIACELSMSGSMYARYPKSFIYEMKNRAGKDVDFSFKRNDTRYSVEVKCFAKRTRTFIEGQGEIKMMGPQVETEFYTQLEKANPGFRTVRSRHSAIVDFLNSARDKFESRESPEDFNILAICCHDAEDVADCLTSIAGDYGMAFDKNREFQSHSERNIRIDEYHSIDAILISNIAQNHIFHMRRKAIDPWNYCSAMHFLVPLHSKEKFHPVDIEVKSSLQLRNDEYHLFCMDRGLKKSDFINNIPIYYDHSKSINGSKLK